MIKINRGPIPKFLNSDKVMAAKKLLAESASKRGRQERLRFDMSILKTVRDDLIRACNNKCAYCESLLGVVSYSDIENFRPKGGARGFNKDQYAPDHYWWLAYEWDNLLVSCQICNQKYKRDYFPLESESMRSRIGAFGYDLLNEQALLIDPATDNPSEHLAFDENSRIFELTKKGKVTIEILGLNRADLVERRRIEASNLQNRLEIIRLTSDFSNQFTREFVEYIKILFSDNPTQPYTAMQRNIFDIWYEQNSELWENAKKKQKDRSKIVRQEKFEKSESTKVAQDIIEVNSILTSLKRFSIKKIEIENFKSIDKLTLNLKAFDEKNIRESWLLLLGDNGIGKSSILQAIALALTTKKQLAKLKLNVADYLKIGTENGKVIIHSYEHNTPITLLFNKSGFINELKEAPTFILAYGSTRLLPKGKIQPDKKQEPYINIRNLFDYSIALNDPNAWLSNINSNDFNERVAPTFFDILALRGDDRLWVNNGKINIQQFGEDHQLEVNSDGYKTVTALVSDIMQTLSIEKANYHNSQGIVLIDEIGNHLHPRWRMKIAGALRKAFPKIQFIVTTHEPLCLRGLSHGEVAVLVRDQKNRIKVLDESLLPDHSLMQIEQLLTSDLFGLINIMDDEAEKTYEEYYNLLSKKEENKTTEDKNKIEELSSIIANKEMLGRTPSEQILYKVIDETYAKKIREEGFQTIENLKKETINEVKEIIGNKKLDWL